MTTFVKASCHCGLNAFNIAFAAQSLPINDDLCHCNTCRHSTGQLVVIHVRFSGVPLAPDSTSNPADLSTLTPYTSSTFVTRWFCSRCSAHILWQDNSAPQSSWCVATGSLERTEGIVNGSYHAWVGDTLDGGIADFLTVIDGVKLPRYAASNTSGEVLPPGWRNLPVDGNSSSEDRLPFYCNCKANTFFITRPSAASALPFSPYPDVTHAYISTPEDICLNSTDEKWWLRNPGRSPHPTHYLAGHCACTSCRTTSGFEIQSWAFVPRANILFIRSGSGAEESVKLELQDQAERPPGLRQYKSSAGRNREFYGTCGATVFWWGEERPDIVDISVGLVDEQYSGVKAEGWLYWWKERVSFHEDAISVKLINGLAEGLKASQGEP